MFSNNPFNEHRAAQKVQESKFLIPEEIPANERTAFHGAAAAAAKAGKKSFNFGGKTHPVTMKKDAATAIADQKEALDKKDVSSVKKVVKDLKGAVKAHGAQAKSLEKDIKDDTQKEGVVKSADKKPENYVATDGKTHTRMVPTTKRKKTEKVDVNMNPKLDKGTKDNSMEQKESTGIRAKLMAVLEGDRAKHYKGATKPETMDDKLKGKGAKDMVNQPKDVDDTEEKGHQDAAKAGKTGPQAKARSGGDNTRSGDQKIKPSATPVKGMKGTMEAYASMNVKDEENGN
jgi:hypothetical protein